MEDWKMTADNKEYVTVLFTDMSKAFQSLHPTLMIQKLKAYGLSEKSPIPLPSILECRKNRVKLQEERSAWKEQKGMSPSGLYSGTCSKMISCCIDSLRIYLCMLKIIKYTLSQAILDEFLNFKVP